MQNYNSTQQYSSFFPAGWHKRKGIAMGGLKENEKVVESQVKFYIIWLIDV